MESFFNDFSEKIQSYYSTFVDLAPRLIVAFFVLLIVAALARLIKGQARKRLTSQMDDPLLANFLARILKIFVWLVGGLIILQVLGLAGVAAGVVTGASVSAIVIGFAFKDIGENFLAGIMLAFNRPFRIGDTVELDGLTGQIVALNMRTTHFKSFDGKDIFIPNASVVKNPVINYTIDGFIRHDFNIGIDYGEDVTKAINVISSVLSDNKNILKDNGKSPVISIGELADSYLNINAKYWIDIIENKVPAHSIRTQLIDRVIDKLTKAGFYLPGNVLEIKNYREDNLKTEKRENPLAPKNKETN